MHGITNGRRGGNRNGPQNIRRGRGATTSSRVPVLGAAPLTNQNVPPSPAIPLRPSTTRSVNRGGLNRRHPWEQVPADSAANKRQTLGDPSTSAANEVVQVEDLDVNATEEVQEQNINTTGPGHAGGTSLLSGSSSSLREKIRELITTPSFLSNLSPGSGSGLRKRKCR